MSGLAPDVVELAPWIPPAGGGSQICDGAGARLREVRFRAAAWLPDEIDTLRALFAADESVDAIAQAVGRGRAAVRDMIFRLGLRRNSVQPWTAHDDRELMRRYGAEAPAAIAQDLGRAVTSVYARARLLGVAEASMPPWSAWEDAQLRAGFEQMIPVGQLATLIGRTAGAAWARAGKLGLQHPAAVKARWSPQECARALELAGEGLAYGFIRQRMADEGFPERSKVAFNQAIRKLGYGRGWGRLWTPEEDELLRRAYAGAASLAPLQERLGRSRGSIAWRAGELGLQGTHPRPGGFRQGPDWTAADTARLREAYGKVPSKQLAAELGRDLRAMYQRAHALGLKHPWMRAFTDEDARVVQVAWTHGVGLIDVAHALGRDVAVVSRFAVRQGYAFSDPNRPASPGKGGGAKKTQRLSRADILALATPDDTFAPPLLKPRGRRAGEAAHAEA